MYHILSDLLFRFSTLSKSLTKYADSINTDISDNGIIPQRMGNLNIRNNYRNSNGKENFGRMKIYNLRGNPNFQNRVGNFRQQQGQISNFKNRRFHVRSLAYNSNDNSHQNKYTKGMLSKEPVFNMNNKGAYRHNRKGPNGYTKRLFCTLCGETGTHLASDICFKMKSPDGRLAHVIPT